MSQFSDEILFTGGLNSDDDLRIISNADYIDALNVISGTREIGSKVNVRGNILIPYNLQSGRNKVIGSIRDIKRNAIIYFIWNENEQHCILHYLCDSQTIEEILAPSAALPVTGIPFDTSFLEFTEFNKIHSANILDNILLWCDGVADDSNPPRKINIKRARDFMLQLTPSRINTPYDNLIASTSTGLLPERLQFINAIKYAPLDKAAIALGTDTTKNTNFLRNKLVQVRYRWIYDDNEKSRWNTGSYRSLPQGQENLLGLISVGVINNFLTITYNTGHPTVKAIDIAFNFDNKLEWFRLDEPIKKYDEDNQRILPDFTDENFIFYNDRVLIPIDQSDTDLNFDAIPLKSQTQEIIDGNRLMYACTLEGLENPELDISTTFGNDLVPISTVSTTIVRANGGVTLAIPYLRQGISAGDIIEWTMTWAGTGYSGTLRYIVKEADFLNYPITLVDHINSYQKWITGAIVTPSNATIGGNLYRTLTFTTVTAVSLIKSFEKVPSFKKGAFHKFGVLYQDEAGRDGGVASNAEFQQYVKTFPELFINGIPTALDAVNAYQSWIDIFINHVPPIWATKYQIVYAGSNLIKYTQFVLMTSPGKTPEGNMEIDCKYIVDYIENQVIDGSLGFQFETGDKLRFIANNEFYCPQYVEVTVVAFNTTNNILTVSNFDWNDVYGNRTSGATTSDGVLVELFHYKNSADPTNQFYFEIGEVYDIVAAGTAGRRHQGNIANQDAAHTTPAQVRIRRGDTYEYQRYFQNPNYLRIVESGNFSDFYISNFFDNSRVQGVRNEIQKVNGQLLRYGGRYFPDTLVNNLLSFNGADLDTLQTTYGNINKILTVGYVVKCLQTKKLTSLYINRSMIFNADGTSQVTLINQVIGTKDPSNLDYGCIHPESVCKDDRQMYFFDINTGAIIQDSANGQFPISSYKASTYFKNKSAEISAAANNDKIFVYAAPDNYNETINFTFSDENTTSEFNSATIIYGTRDNRWLSLQSYIGDYMVSNALVFVTFKEGALYVHNDINQLRNNFYGVQYSSTIKFVSNINSENVKIFDSLAVNSNKVWFCPNNDITIPANGNSPNGMASRLLANKFRAKEGVWYADFLRDINTPNKIDPILNGQRLRGTFMVIQLTNEDTEQVILFSVLVKSSYSPLSG